AGPVFESNEANNVFTVPITILVPDRVPSSLTAPATVLTQAPVTVSWTVENQGTGTAAPGRNDDLWLSTDTVLGAGDIFLTEQAQPGGLAVGASDTATRTFTVPNVAPGNYFLLLTVDYPPPGPVFESNEGNNNFAQPITIQAPVCGDGIVTSGEQCDLGGANGSTTSCCTATCQFRASG